MARIVNDNIQNNSPKSLDNKYTKFINGLSTPYASIAEANSTIPFDYRSIGLTVLITIGGANEEYWYFEGIADNNLVPKYTSKPLFALYENDFIEDGTVIPPGYTTGIPLIKINPNALNNSSGGSGIIKVPTGQSSYSIPANTLVEYFWVIEPSAITFSVYDEDALWISPIDLNAGGDIVESMRAFLTTRTINFSGILSTTDIIIKTIKK